MRAFVPVCGTTKMIASKADAEFYVWLHNCCKWWFGRECEMHANVSFFSASDAPAHIICSMILVERFHYLWCFSGNTVNLKLDSPVVSVNFLPNSCNAMQYAR